MNVICIFRLTIGDRLFCWWSCWYYRLCSLTICCTSTARGPV